MTRLYMLMALAACAPTFVPEPPNVVLDPQFVDLGRVYLGQAAERRVTVANMGAGSSTAVLEALSLNGEGASYLVLKPVIALPANLVAPVPVVVEARPPADAKLGPYTLTLVAAGTANGQAFERSTIVTLDVYDCDEDGDGFMSANCDGADCDDLDSSVFPGATEVCNGVDDDCNLLVDDTVDADGDGYTICDDCDDGDREVNPGAVELCNGIDDDCDGALPVGERDADVDGYRGCEGDCDDGDALVNPDAPELCDGKDSDCDGLLPPSEADFDTDGVPICRRDCDDNDPLVYPGAPEQCNGLDDDCDEIIDEAGACPCDRVERGRNIYLFCTTGLTWLNAANRCDGWNYSIVTINDAAEDAFVFATARSVDSSRKWWMGLNDRAVEGRWEWESGDPVFYTNWNPIEPNDSGGGEDCGQLNRYGDGTWNDEPCTTALPMICELN